jgi:rubrerythrin
MKKIEEKEPTEGIRNRIEQNRERAIALLLDAAQMYRRGGVNDQAVKLLKQMSEDESMQASTLSTRVDRELRILGEGG